MSSQEVRGPSDAGGTIVLTGADLTIADVERVARGDARVTLDDDARARMQEARQLIEDLVAEGAVVYGVTTGFGDLASVSIAPADAARLQENLLMSHAAGVGDPFDVRDRQVGPGQDDRAARAARTPDLLATHRAEDSRLCCRPCSTS